MTVGTPNVAVAGASCEVSPGAGVEGTSNPFCPVHNQHPLTGAAQLGEGKAAERPWSTLQYLKALKRAGESRVGSGRTRGNGFKLR